MKKPGKMIRQTLAYTALFSIAWVSTLALAENTTNTTTPSETATATTASSQTPQNMPTTSSAATTTATSTPATTTESNSDTSTKANSSSNNTNASTTNTSGSNAPKLDLSSARGEKPVLVPSAPAVDAVGYVLMDADSGAILAGKNMDKHLQPASLTKLMTVYVASQTLRQGQIHLDDKVLISQKAWKMDGSRMFVQVGTYVPVKELLDGIIVASGNDSCVAIAEHIAGGEDSFANLMNQDATALGMQNTHFIDSTGMPNDNHYSSPHDLALLSKSIINDFPEDYTWYKQKWISYNNIRQPNRNRMLWRDPTVDGLKTGHTDSAGFCLVASAKRENMRLISVIMGASSDRGRADDTQQLLNWGFHFFNTYKLFDANKSLATARVWLGKKSQIDLGLASPLAVTIQRGQYSNLHANMKLNDKISAPIKKGTACGLVQVKLGDQVVASAPLIALNDDPTANALVRMIDKLKLMIKH